MAISQPFLGRECRFSAWFIVPIWRSFLPNFMTITWTVQFFAIFRSIFIRISPFYIAIMRIVLWSFLQNFIWIYQVVQFLERLRGAKFYFAIPCSLSKFHPDVIILNIDQDTDPKKLHGQFHDDTWKCLTFRVITRKSLRTDVRSNHANISLRRFRG